VKTETTTTSAMRGTEISAYCLLLEPSKYFTTPLFWIHKRYLKRFGQVSYLAAPAVASKPASVRIEVKPAVDNLAGVGSSMELFEKMSGQSSDAPLCMTCGTKMRMAGSCFVCEGCGNTSGCS